jgi:hypothetical protein
VTSPTRRKLRNCIRKDTYRYFFDLKILDEVWPLIEKEYGVGKILKGFNIIVVETDRLIIKRGVSECKFTLIKKKLFNKQDEDQFHQIVGFI